MAKIKTPRNVSVTKTDYQFVQFGQPDPRPTYASTVAMPLPSDIQLSIGLSATHQSHLCNTNQDNLSINSLPPCLLHNGKRFSRVIVENDVLYSCEDLILCVFDSSSFIKNIRDCLSYLKSKGIL